MNFNFAHKFFKLGSFINLQNPPTKTLKLIILFFSSIFAKMRWPFLSVTWGDNFCSNPSYWNKWREHDKLRI